MLPVSGCSQTSAVSPLGVPLALAVALKWNPFNQWKLLQLGLIDWRRSPR